MVKAKMCYSAVFNDRKTQQCDPLLLKDEPDLFGQICPKRTDLIGMVTVREPESLFYWLDSVKNHAVCGIV